MITTFFIGEFIGQSYQHPKHAPGLFDPHIGELIDVVIFFRILTENIYSGLGGIVTEKRHVIFAVSTDILTPSAIFSPQALSCDVPSR
jgi:hypothetical protein